jgi:E3 SUMO-protein ligase NSE2
LAPISVLLDKSTLNHPCLLSAEDGDESDDDDDVEVGGMIITLRDPLTKAWLEDPVTS